MSSPVSEDGLPEPRSREPWVRGMDHKSWTEVGATEKEMWYISPVKKRVSVFRRFKKRGRWVNRTIADFYGEDARTEAIEYATFKVRMLLRDLS